MLVFSAPGLHPQLLLLPRSAICPRLSALLALILDTILQFDSFFCF